MRGQTHLAWLGKGGARYPAVEVVHCHRDDLPAVDGESAGKLTGREVLTWAPILHTL